MTTEELREIDRRVALALGWEFKQIGWWIAKSANGNTRGVSSPFCFTTDPAAADLVRLEIERRGWTWGLGQVPNKPCAAAVNLHSDPALRHYAHESPWMLSLCLAFLAAVEAEAAQ